MEALDTARHAERSVPASIKAERRKSDEVRSQSSRLALVGGLRELMNTQMVWVKMSSEQVLNQPRFIYRLIELGLPISIGRESPVRAQPAVNPIVEESVHVRF